MPPTAIGARRSSLILKKLIISYIIGPEDQKKPRLLVTVGAGFRKAPRRYALRADMQNCYQLLAVGRAAYCGERVRS